MGIESDLPTRLRPLSDDASLRVEENFIGRHRALDLLEDILAAADPPAPPGEAASLKESLEALDASLFRRLRSRLRSAPRRGEALQAMLDVHVPAGFRAPLDAPGYDALDAFLNGLLQPDPLPPETRPLAEGMIPFQKTPGRIILEMIAQARFGPGDVFFDVGAGPGQIPILAHALTGVRAVGLEWEPAYVVEARSRAADLGLSGVEFLPIDARLADYAPATVLFLYTPCLGPVLEAVSERMRVQCRSGARVFTYGPCTAAFSRLSWLSPRSFPSPEMGDGLASFVKP